MSGKPGSGDRSVLEVEFTIRDPAQPFVGISQAEGCTFELAEIVPRQSGRYAEFFNITGVRAERVLDLGTGVDTIEVTLLREFEDGGLFEFLVAENCPAVTLAEHGALPREIRGENGTGRIVAEIPAQSDPSVVIEAFLAEYPEAELRAKRRQEAVDPLFSDSAFRQVLHSRLTDRQREVIRAAFEAGYYEWPRECTGSEIADELGISSATFSEHIHAAERKLLRVLFEDPG